MFWLLLCKTRLHLFLSFPPQLVSRRNSFAMEISNRHLILLPAVAVFVVAGALLGFAWLFRYETLPPVQVGEQTKLPLLLWDRWTHRYCFLVNENDLMIGQTTIRNPAHVQCFDSYYLANVRAHENVELESYNLFRSRNPRP